MAFSRRKFLLGLGGAAVGLPFFEGLAPKEARAANGPPPYALFYRRGNGVQQAIYSRNSYPSQGFWTQTAAQETERWWPMKADGVTPYPFGALNTLGPISAMNELESYVSQMTVVRGLRHPYGTENGHPEGAVQGLTGAGVQYGTPPLYSDVPDFLHCTPLGESLDNLIARQLTPKNPLSLYMGFQTQADASISWQKEGTSVIGRAAVDNLLNIYNQIFYPYTIPDATRQLLVNQRKSVNDLVRADIVSLRNDPRMSKGDQDRLAVHLNAIRETEVALAACVVPGTLAGDVQNYDQSSITAAATVMGKLAALAISCGIRRSVVLNIGIPQDIITYGEVSPTVGSYLFHAISHRQTADQDGSAALPAAQGYHHSIDRYHLQRFKSILDQLSAYAFPDGTTLVDKGVNVHFSDLGSGEHINTQLPYFYVGGAQNKLVTGQYVNEDKTYLVKFLNTIGAAVGCLNEAGDAPLDDLNARNGVLPDHTVVTQNNNYKSHNYTDTRYFQPAPGVYQAPADGKPPITGRITALVK